MLTLYGIKNCDSCRAARKALAAKNIDYKFHDLREDGVSATDIKRWLKSHPMDVLLNKRGTTWRGLSDKDKAKTNKAELIALICAQPTLLKRPICEKGAKIHIGWHKDVLAALI